MEQRMSGQVDPAQIMQVGMGFWASKTLLSAVELELFTKLGREGLTAEQIREELELHPRAVPDFPDALVALALLDRDDEAATPSTATRRPPRSSSTRRAPPTSAGSSR